MKKRDVVIYLRLCGYPTYSCTAPFEFMYERDIVYTYSAEVDEWHQLTNRTFYEWARAYVEDKGIATQHDRITQTMVRCVPCQGWGHAARPCSLARSAPQPQTA